MNFPKKALLGSLLVMSASSAFAVDTANLEVKGTIAPTTCTPTFVGGNIVDYGVIPAASLSPTARTELASHSIAYSITCDAPISIGTYWSDSRAASAVGGGNTGFGLGVNNSNNIGSYTLKHDQAAAQGDGVQVDMIRRAGTGAWVLATTGLANNAGNTTESYAPVGTLVPGTYSVFSGALDVTATINGTDGFDLTSSVILDGLSTMTVRYL